MMKNKLAAMLVVFLSLTTMAQEADSLPPAQSPTLLFEIGYSNAIRYNDLETATTKLYDIIAFYPQDDSLRMELALLYFERQMYPSALLVAMDVIKINPAYEEAIELSAICYENLGLKDKALQSYENLYLRNNNIQYLYKMCFMQYELGRYRECITNAEILMDNPAASEQTSVFQVSETEQKEFPYNVAVLNLRGLANKELGNIDQARADWNKALEMAPDFIFARKNLESLAE